MEKYITDEHTGLKYELVGDYYLIAGDNEPKQEPIGVWGAAALQIPSRTQARHLFRPADFRQTGQLSSGH